jgi:hypothetical protein
VLTARAIVTFLPSSFSFFRKRALWIAALTSAAILAGCGARSGLYAGQADAGPDAVDAGDDVAPGADACGGEHLGTVARTPLGANNRLGGVFAKILDPDDDLLLVLAIPNPGAGTPADMTAIALATGDVTRLTIAGDSRVNVGTAASAVWDGANHRAVVLGGPWEDAQGLPTQTKQVYAIRVEGTQAVLSLLPDFPGGPTAPTDLALAIDPARSRLVAVADKEGVASDTKTYALDLSPGRESWSLLDDDNQSAVQNVVFGALTYDPAARRVIGRGATLFDSKAPTTHSLWALSLDAPSGWTRLTGTIPPPVEDAFGPVAWAPVASEGEACGFLFATTGSFCVYDVWRLDVVASSFVISPVGVAVQPQERYGRGFGVLDPRRMNFVFAGGSDCEMAEFETTTTDFLPVLR